MKLSELKDYNLVAPAPPAPERSALKDLGIGAAKGAGDTAMSLVKAGRPILAALDPTKTLQDYKSQTMDSDARIEEALKSDNATQKTGKVLEFFAEAFFPAKALGLTGTASKVAGATFKGASQKLANIGDDAIDGGVKIKDQLVDLITNLDDKTKTALQRTPKEKFQSVVEQGRKAMLDDRNRTPLEAVGDNVIAALKQLNDQAGAKGAAKSQIMEQAKIGYKRVGNIAQRSALDIQKAFSGVRLDPSDTKLVNEFKQTLLKLGDNPSLKAVDATIDQLQDKLYKTGRSNAVEVTDRITGKLRASIGKLNSQVKTLGGKQYEKLNDEYGELADIVRELNARLGKEGSSAGALVKRLFSPSDARTKELFDILEKKTGQDFFRDARLAKFVMETLGDSRAQSLLEQLPRSAGGVLDKVVEYGASKLTDPIKAAEKYLKK